MAAATLLVLEAANIFVNDLDKSVVIRDVALPKLEEIKIPHVPGGSIGEINLSLGVRHLEVSFSLVGRDSDTLNYFGASNAPNGFGNRFVIYEALRNKSKNSIEGAVARITGRLSSVTFEPFRRGTLASVDYVITEITAYVLTITGKEIYNYNWLAGSFKVHGVEQNIKTLTVYT